MSMNNSKTWLIIGALVIVVGGILYLGGDFPGGDDQASGTIVPAERYRGEQVSGSDVQLGDESVAQLMQTDLFEAMVNDAAFADAMALVDFDCEGQYSHISPCRKEVYLELS